MGQKHVWGVLLAVSFLLCGTSSTFAAVWDKQCHIAIDDIQWLMKSSIPHLFTGMDILKPDMRSIK
jgi:hypothetical protein